MSTTTPKVTFEGNEMRGEAGDTIAHVLLSNNIWRFGGGGSKRGPFCNMGVCYDCLIRVRYPDMNRMHVKRACLTLIVDGMHLSRLDSDAI